MVDIKIQASALYFRWLQPLLAYDQSTIDSHPVSYLLSFHIRNVNACQYHYIPLLFPISRSQGLKKQRTNIVDMLYNAVDLLPHSFHAARLSTATAMVLSLQAAFYVPAKVKQMLVSDVFQYDPRINFIHWKDTRDPFLLAWKRAPPTVFKGLATGKLKFQPYFVPVFSPAPLENSVVSFASFVNQFKIYNGQSISNAKASSKIFRLLVISSVIPPLALRNILSTHWKFFLAVITY